MKMNKKRVERNADLVRLGENIRNRREALGMSQTELALATGNQCYALSKYENGDREMGVLKLLSIAEELRISPAVLMGASKSAGRQIEAINQRILDLPDSAREKVLYAIELLLLGIESTI